ncbi:hypothetical protein [Paenibacillus agilis]|uniref:Uncharacterized protein n=1 Tax=Paenibacillus agilis TaxID=3020863 RepID=A0A559J305_9BACL|nr:hypothetical protein [Paenibacillus agilis]TVX94268.1 hypothetical protein FPZ44_15145 [Paenibacillus agilis]
MRLGKRATSACMRILIFVLIASAIPFSSHAQPTEPIPWDTANQSSEMKHILQQSLSIQELDAEIARVTARENEASKQRQLLEADLQKQQEQLLLKQKDAGRVLRSYYVGERDLILEAILSSGEISDLFLLLNYYSYLMDSDHRILSGYQANVQRIDQLRNDQALLEKELSQVRINLENQRKRVIELQHKLDTQITSSSDPEAMKKLVEEFTKYWQSVGLFEVRHYFRAMADAMQKLPEFVKENGNMKSNGLQYTLRIKDSELNEFLRQQDSMFDDFEFVFDKGIVTAIGDREGLRVVVQGSYTLEQEPENALRFHVDHLQFNGLELAESTRKQLEEQFDLSFYPQQLVSFIQATEITIDKNEMVVVLKVSL